MNRCGHERITKCPSVALSDEPGATCSECAKPNDLDRLRGLLSDVYHALREPENGVHYCRGCDAGTHNGWHHAPACGLEARGAEVLRLRSRIRAALGEAWPPSVTVSGCQDNCC